MIISYIAGYRALGLNNAISFSIRGCAQNGGHLTTCTEQYARRLALSHRRTYSHISMAVFSARLKFRNIQSS